MTSLLLGPLVCCISSHVHISPLVDAGASVDPDVVSWRKGLQFPSDHSVPLSGGTGGAHGLLGNRPSKSTCVILVWLGEFSGYSGQALGCGLSTICD
jgi:hypothetical protein